MTTFGDVGTVGQNTIEVFDNERECLRIATELVDGKKASGYGVTSEGYIAKYELPSTLRKNLAERSCVNNSAGSFVLFASQEIKLISVVVDHHRISNNSEVRLPGNPYGERKGVFCTTAYSLVAESPDQYPAEGLLVWLPLLELFGTWDRTHQQLYVFADISWAEIANDLPDYLRRCIEKEGLLNILECEKLLDNFDFIPDDLPDRIKNILSGPLEIKRSEAEEFLGLYEQRLLRHPWCSELETTYEALVNLYHRLGQLHERDAEYNEAIEWLGRSLLVVNQSHHFRSQVFIDIFIQLSFCYFETSKFDSSLRYMKMYQVYDASAWETCEQIITSISRVKQLYEEAIMSGHRAIKQRSADCYEEAIRITHEAVKIAPNDPLLYFNLACFYSLSYKTKEALYYLEEALKKGYKNHRQITHDEDLENIRNTREFEVICQRYL